MEQVYLRKLIKSRKVLFYWQRNPQGYLAVICRYANNGTIFWIHTLHGHIRHPFNPGHHIEQKNTLTQRFVCLELETTVDLR